MIVITIMIIKLKLIATIMRVKVIMARNMIKR